MKNFKLKSQLAYLCLAALAFIISTVSCTKIMDEEEPLQQNRVSTSLARTSLAQVGISITDFGAVGDGKTDNYQAFVDAAAYASAHENTTINFPSGTFYISKYRKIKNDPITHIMWKNCKGLKIIGTTGTVVSVNGTFFRPLDYTLADGSKKSYTGGISPFYFDNCTDIEIRNIEVNGNVQNTTRAPGINDQNPSVTESDNILLRFTLCDSVVVDQMYLHHAESDGIMISGRTVNNKWRDSTNINMTNVRSYHNGRQGMSTGGCAKSTFKNCEFSYNGFTDGTYGRNDPSAGVDIEPGVGHTIDNLKFESCSFESNYGGQFLCTAPTRTTNITLLNCFVYTGIETEKPQGITILAKNTLIDGCTIKLGTRTIKITNVDKPGATTTITNCLIEGSVNCINSSSTNLTDNVIISNNEFRYTKDVIIKNFIALTTTNVQFLNNKIFISAAAIKSRPKGNHSIIQNAIISKGNMFYSENPALKPTISYTGTKTVADL